MSRKKIQYLTLILFLICLLNIGVPCISVCAEAMSMPASFFHDLAGHWAEREIKAWSARGLVGGYPDGTFRPDYPITRAEFVALVNRSFGFARMVDTAGGQVIVPESYCDVTETDWYAVEFAEAAAVGYLGGYPDGTAKPQNPITRQEVATVLARILPVHDNPDLMTDDVLKSFIDEAQIPAWSREAITMAVIGGYMSGYPDGSFQPTKKITRAEAIAVLDRAVGQLFYRAGIYGPFQGTLVLEGNVTINTPGVTLQNMTITGNLYLTEGIGEGDVTLNNVTVQGTTKIGGGGANSIHLLDTKMGSVLVNVPNRNLVRILAQGNTAVGTLEARTPARLEEQELTGSGFTRVRINNQQETTLIVELLAELDEVEIHSPAVQLNVQKGRINSLILTATAASAAQASQEPESSQSAQSTQSVQINLAAQTTVGNLLADTPVVAQGQGTIEITLANVDGVVIEAQAKNVFLVDGVQAVVAGKTITEHYQYVEPKKKSKDASLSDLRINGTTVEDFAPDTLSYEVVLPFGTTAVPEVTATAHHAKARVSVTQATALTESDNVATVQVTAENRQTRIYTVTFMVAEDFPKAITEFYFADLGEDGVEGIIDEDEKTITVTVPHDTVVTSLTPTIAHSGVSIEPASGQARDFTDPVTYTVTAEDDTTAEYTVTVIVETPVTGVSLKKAVLFLIKGENETLEVDIDPDDATNTGVTWTSDKPNVATVDEDGKVTAVELGTAKITATTMDGGKEAICWVKVVASDSDIPVLGDSCVLYLDGSIGNDPTSDDYTWYDLSGKGNHGTLQGFDDENSGGWTKQGLKFDGVNDYVIKDVPDSFLEDGKHTVEIWCNPANLEGFRGFIEIADKNTVNNIRLGRIMSYDNVNTIRYHSTFIGGSPYQYIEAEIGLNKDVHLAGTFDGSKTILYINGVKVDEILGTDVPTFTEGQKAIFIGRDLYLDIERYFKGTIYGARIYNRALSPEEIAQNYASTDLQRSLKLNKAVLFLKNGTTADESLIATIEPDGTTPHDVTWTSDKPNIATVDEYGNVTAEALGTAKITATTMDGGKEAFCWVKVVSSDFVIDDSCVLYLDGRMGYDSTVKAWYDLSGEENHGTLWGFDDEGSSGWTEEGLEFDGVDDYVELADAASLNFTEGITIEAWIKPEDITGEHSIICKSYDSSGNGYELQIYNQELRYRVNQPTKHWASSTGIGLREDEWQHVAVTYDCEQVRFYKDGILINTLPVEGGLYNSTAPIEIGVYHNKEEDFFEGSICQVAVYNRALFLEEIARNYFAATNSEPLEPVVGAVLDLCAAEEKISLDPDGTGIWQDASENEQDATMYNVAFTEGDEAEDWPGLEFNGVNSYAEVTSDIDSYLTSDDSITLESFVTFKELDYENENGKLITMVKKGVPDKEEAHSGFALAYDNRNNGQIFKYTCFGNTAGGYCGGGNNFESVSRKLENNKAYHFVVTINDSDATLFIDGEPVLRKQINNLDLTTEGSLFIGRWGAIYAPLVIHHLRIYDRALTDLEVLQNYLACIKRS